MAPGADRRRRAIAAAVCIALLSGCAAGPARGPRPASEDLPAPPSQGIDETEQSRPRPTRALPREDRRDRPSPPQRDGKALEDKLRFPATRRVLDREIDDRADALTRGPIGERGAELASLRLAAAAHDLIEAGSPDGAFEAAEKATALDPRNGYAALWLAVLEHRRGSDARAAELARKARRELPQAPELRPELEALEDALGRAR